MYIAPDPKSKYFHLIYKVNGKRKKVSTKKSTREEAELFLKDFTPPEETVQSSVSHIVPVLSQPIPATPLPQSVATGKTLSAFEREYITHLSHSKTQHYLRSVKLSFKQLRLFAGDIQLEEISHRTAEQFITQTFSRTKRGAWPVSFIQNMFRSMTSQD